MVGVTSYAKVARVLLLRALVGEPFFFRFLGQVIIANCPRDARLPLPSERFWMAATVDLVNLIVQRAIRAFWSVTSCQLLHTGQTNGRQNRQVWISRSRHLEAK